jgi:hypothetical protein
LIIFFQIIAGWFYGHIAEYFIHKHVLHNNKLFKKNFKRHFGTHHRISRKNEMYDKNYEKTFHNDSLFELLGLSLLLLLHFPLFFIVPYFWLTLLYSAISYYTLHRISHIHVSWGKKWLPWHYAHHMHKNQHENWGVRLPLIDWLIK